MFRSTITWASGPRLVALASVAVLLTALMPVSASATVTTPIPSPAALFPPPIPDMPSAGADEPPAGLIADPITPEAACGDWAVLTTYGGAWPTDQSWWEFSCTHATGPCVGGGACNADQHSNDHWTYVDHFTYGEGGAVFYGESFSFYYYDDWAQEASQCDLWWDQATTRWYVAPDPMCPFAPAPPPPPNKAPIAAAVAGCSGLICSFDAGGSWIPTARSSAMPGRSATALRLRCPPDHIDMQVRERTRPS